MIAKSQTAVNTLLDGMLRSERLPHSLCFVGPEGVGKELMAVDFAARLNCETPDDDERRACPSCRKVRTLEHADVHLVYPVPSADWQKSVPVVIASRREDFFNYGEFGNRARSIGINIIRTVIEAVSKQPYEGRHNVVVVFEAHLATIEAQNAVLKLLEEPPASTVVVLVTENPDLLLPTIVSRCQQVRFNALPAEAVSAVLETFYSVEKGEARRIAAHAQGNLRRSIKFLDERFLSIRKDAISLIKLVLDGKTKELLGESQPIAFRYSREEIEELFAETIGILRLIMREQSGAGEEAGSDFINRQMGAERLRKARSRNIPADITTIRRAALSLKRNANTELTISQLLLDLTGKWY
jgi:DNA polymerase-3 subunit delta'